MIKTLLKKIPLFYKSKLIHSRRSSLSYGNRSLICRASQSTGFYMIGTTVMKELKAWNNFELFSQAKQLKIIQAVRCHLITFPIAFCLFLCGTETLSIVRLIIS